MSNKMKDILSNSQHGSRWKKTRPSKLGKNQSPSTISSAHKTIKDTTKHRSSHSTTKELIAIELVAKLPSGDAHSMPPNTSLSSNGSPNRYPKATATGSPLTVDGSVLGAAAVGLQFYPATEGDHDAVEFYPNPPLPAVAKTSPPSPVKKTGSFLKTFLKISPKSSPKGGGSEKKGNKHQKSPTSIMDAPSLNSSPRLTSFPRGNNQSCGNHQHVSWRISDYPSAADNELTNGSVPSDGHDHFSRAGCTSIGSGMVEGLNDLQQVLFGKPIVKVDDKTFGDIHEFITNGKDVLVGAAKDAVTCVGDTATKMDNFLSTATDLDKLEEGDDDESEWEDTFATGDTGSDTGTYPDEDDTMAQTLSTLSSEYQPRKITSKTKSGAKFNSIPRNDSHRKKSSSGQKTSNKLSSSQGQRRGRSLTAKTGFNSDGESICYSFASPSRGSSSASLGVGHLLADGLSDSSASSMSLTQTTASDRELESGVRTGVLDRLHTVKVRNTSDEGSGGSSFIRGEDTSTVAEGILTQDQAIWMEMTRAQQEQYQQKSSSNRQGKDETSGYSSAFSPYRRGKDEASTIVSGHSTAASSSGNAVFMLQREENDVDRYFKMIASGHSTSASSSDNAVFMLPREVNAGDGYFKKLLSVGIQLLLNESPAALRNTGDSKQQRRSGKMFLKFGNAQPNGQFDHPQLCWADDNDANSYYHLELLSIQSVRKPTMFELENYTQAIPAHSFLVVTTDGTSLVFEAVDEVQMNRVSSALKWIISRLAKKIIMGENDWMIQMMVAAAGGVQNFDMDLESVVPDVKADCTDHLVKKTTLIGQAQKRRSHLRTTRGSVAIKAAAIEGEHKRRSSYVLGAT